MSDTQAQFSVLRQTADPAVVEAISQLIAKGEDRDLNRINLLDFSARYGLDEEKVISAFLHSARLGLFDLSWNVLCPGCGGVLGAHNTLKSLRHDDYNCALCAAGLRGIRRRPRGGFLHRQSPRQAYRRARSQHAADLGI